MKLFEIHEAIELLLATEVDHETGEITDETIAKLDELELTFKDKCLAVAAYLKGERAEGDAVKEQAKRLADRAAGHHKRADRLEEYLAQHATPGEELRDATSWIKWRKTTSVLVESEELVPEDYIRTKVTKQPDKPGIAKALKSGKDVPGCHLVERLKLNIQ